MQQDNVSPAIVTAIVELWKLYTTTSNKRDKASLGKQIKALQFDPSAAITARLDEIEKTVQRMSMRQGLQ